MKKLFLFLVAAISGLFGSHQVSQNLGATSVFLPIQGGTGVSSTAIGNVGTCLQVASVNPLVYTFGTCSGGSGSFTTTTINGLTTTAYTFVGAGGLTIATSGPGTITLTQGAGGGGSGSVGTSTIGFPAVYDTANSVTGTSKLTSSQITEADPIFSAYPAVATSTFLNQSFQALASSTYLLQSVFGPYPAFATSTFLTQINAAATYLPASYTALATSTFLDQAIFGAYPAFASSSFLGIGFQALASSTYMPLSMWGPYPAFATSSFLGIGFQALASSTYLPATYPASATSTFLSKSGGTMTGGLTMTDATTTNFSVSGVLALPNNSVTDAMISSASLWNSFVANYPALATSTFLSQATAASTYMPLSMWGPYPAFASSSFLGVGFQALVSSTYLTQANAATTYLPATYPALATSTFLLQSVFGPYPAFATSSFLGVGFQALASSTYLSQSYPASATSTFVSKAATPAVTSTYQITSGGANIIQPIPTTSLRFSGSNATTTMYQCGFVNNNFTSSKLQTVIHATAATGIQFILSYGANCDGSTASTTIGTFVAQNQVGGTIQNVAVTIPANNYLVIQGLSASSTNIDAFDFALLGHNFSN